MDELALLTPFMGNVAKDEGGACFTFQDTRAVHVGILDYVQANDDRPVNCFYANGELHAIDNEGTCMKKVALGGDVVKKGCWWGPLTASFKKNWIRDATLNNAAEGKSFCRWVVDSAHSRNWDLRSRRIDLNVAFGFADRLSNDLRGFCGKAVFAKEAESFREQLRWAAKRFE